MPAWDVSSLKKAHNREGFDCGEEALNAYIQKYASQDVKRKLSQVFVATQGSNCVVGYYTISASSFHKDSLAEEQAKKLPAYPVPAAIIGRLAVDVTCQGKGLGEFLLMDALHRIASASETLAVYAVIVDAKNARAKAFYQKYGFIPFKTQKSRLFIELKTVQAAL